MARIENTSARPFDITFGAINGVGGKLIQIPRGKGGEASDQNGVAEVDDALLAEAREKDPFVKALFDSGDLVIKSGGAVKSKTASQFSDNDDSKASKK